MWMRATAAMAAAGIAGTIIAGCSSSSASRPAGPGTQQTGAPQMSLPRHAGSVPASRPSAGVRPSPDGAQAANAAFTEGQPADPFSTVAQPTLEGYDANARPDRFAALQLYGDLPQDRSPRASSMDGADNLRRVSFTTEGNDFDPDIDPTGQWLVYASTRHRETADLYLKRIDGAAVTQLTADPANDVMPAFSPDGRRIAFASDRAGNWDIYIIDITGGQPVQVTNSPAHEIHPSWSPDASTLVYSTLGQQSGQWELVTVEVERPTTKKFIGYGLFPNWSPVDNRIVFQRARERGTRWFSVWVIELDAQGEAQRPTEIAAATNAACITPDWSPDGRHVVFCTVVEPGSDDATKPTQADVWIVSADGRHRANLTQSRFANLQPVWGADSTVYFVSDRAQLGVENVWALRPDQVLRMAQPVEDRSSGPAPTVMAPTP